MTLPTNDGAAKRELSASELDAIPAGLHLTFGPNPPRGDIGIVPSHGPYGFPGGFSGWFHLPHLPRFF